MTAADSLLAAHERRAELLRWHVRSYRALLLAALQLAHEQHQRIQAQQATIDGQRAELQRYCRERVTS